MKKNATLIIGIVFIALCVAFPFIVGTKKVPVQSCDMVTIEVTFDGACQQFQQVIGKDLVEGVGMQQAFTDFLDRLGLGTHRSDCPSFSKHRIYGFSLRPSYPGTIRIQISVPICSVDDTVKKLRETGFVSRIYNQGSKPRVEG